MQVVAFILSTIVLLVYAAIALATLFFGYAISRGTLASFLGAILAGLDWLIPWGLLSGACCVAALLFLGIKQRTRRVGAVLLSVLALASAAVVAMLLRPSDSFGIGEIAFLLPCLAVVGVGVWLASVSKPVAFNTQPGSSAGPTGCASESGGERSIGQIEPQCPNASTRLIHQGNVAKRGAYALAMIVSFVALAVVLVPEGFLGCTDELAEHSPDGYWTLHVCRRPMFFGMPGSSGDAPAWIVLRDPSGAIRGVSSLGMIQMAFGLPTEWTEAKVERPLVVEFSLVRAPNAFMRWLDDRFWRLRAWLGLTTSDDDFH